MFHKLSFTFNSLCERVAVWMIRGFLVRYSAVLAKEFARLDAESAKFKAEVMYVSADHHKRLLALEDK